MEWGTLHSLVRIILLLSKLPNYNFRDAFRFEISTNAELVSFCYYTDKKNFAKRIQFSVYWYPIKCESTQSTLVPE